MSATMETVSIEGAELEFDDQGSGEPVVLIHGSGPADSFLPLALEPPLRDHYRVVRYHRRGIRRKQRRAMARSRSRGTRPTAARCWTR